MPLPIILGIAAVVAGTTGVGLGIKGGVDMANANKKLKSAKERDDSNMSRLKRMNTNACKAMDVLGKNEMQALSALKEFSDLFERIHNRPDFKEIKIGKVSIPNFKGEDVKQASVGASVLVGGLGGAALGTAGYFAASGATTAAVMALGTASTGTAISTLSGVAATNATLAALGGVSLAAGGGGMALGASVLGAATLGVGLLVGGIIFSLTGSSISGKADKAWEQMIDNEKKINKICNYLWNLKKTAEQYNVTLSKIRNVYLKQLSEMRSVIHAYGSGNTDWNRLSDADKLVIENMVMIVGVLYNMCKVQLVSKSSNSDINVINKSAIHKAESDANVVISQMRQSA